MPSARLRRVVIQQLMPQEKDLDRFEEIFLRCTMEIGIVPGPIPDPLNSDQPFYSFTLGALEEYPALALIQTISQIAGVEVIHLGGMTSEEEWYAWRWRWNADDKSIDIGFSIFDATPPVYWGGSSLTANCTFADLITVFHAVRARHPGVWLHDRECHMLTPHHFLTLYALPRLDEAFTHPDPAIRSRAQQTLQAYSRLGLHDEITS